MKKLFLLFVILFLGCQETEFVEPKNFEISILESSDSVSMTVIYRTEGDCAKFRILNNYADVVEYKKEVQFLLEKLEETEVRLNALSNSRISQASNQSSLEKGQ